MDTDRIAHALKTMRVRIIEQNGTERELTGIESLVEYLLQVPDDIELDIDEEEDMIVVRYPGPEGER